ncbi:MAG: hypothetical protein GVY22_06585 [Gammaproteobacteria bacterium]|jgi:hypothetical protein|nr:hypothetical protein [Gammaproteobacteria bacterium]
MSQQRIKASELRDDLLPKLRAVEAAVERTLADRLRLCADEEDRKRFQGLKSEFELEIMMIRMNLRHLFRREALVLERVFQGDDVAGDKVLVLDEQEASAIKRTQLLFQRSQALLG